MKIARLNHRIDLLEPRLTQDGYGGYSTEFVKAKGVWAEVKNYLPTSKDNFDTSVEKNTTTLRIRPFDSIKKGWHVIWQGREHEVVSVTRVYKDSVLLEIVEYEAGV